MKREIIQTFFLDDEQLYIECIDKNLSYYVTRIKQQIELKNPPYVRNKLFYINSLLKTLDVSFKNTPQLNQIDLYQFFKNIYHFDKSNYFCLLKENINQLAIYFNLSTASQDNLAEYKKTVAYSGLDDVYFKKNNTLHNKILDITQEFNLEMSLDQNILSQKALGNTPLVLACKTGHSKAVLCFTKGHHTLALDVNEPDERGMTALHWACFYRDDVLIQELLNAGALISTQNIDGNTPVDLYETNIDEGISFYSSDIRPKIFPTIPHLCDKTLQYAVREDGTRKSSWIDIVFHMDKIAFHQLKVDLKQLNQEIITVKSQHKECLDTLPNRIFEIYTFYHLNQFIKTRNQINIDDNLLGQLSKQKNIKPSKKEHEAEEKCSPIETSIPSLQNALPLTCSSVNTLKQIIVAGLNQFNLFMPACLHVNEEKNPEGGHRP